MALDRRRAETEDQMQDQDGAWSWMQAAVLSILCVEKKVVGGKKKILAKWSVTDDDDKVKTGQNLLTQEGKRTGLYLGRHRQALVETKKELKTIGKRESTPDSEDKRDNLMHGATNKLKQFVENKLRKENVELEDVTLEKIVDILTEKDRKDKKTYWLEEEETKSSFNVNDSELKPDAKNWTPKKGFRTKDHNAAIKRFDVSVGKMFKDKSWKTAQADKETARWGPGEKGNNKKRACRERGQTQEAQSRPLASTNPKALKR